MLNLNVDYIGERGVDMDLHVKTLLGREGNRLDFPSERELDTDLVLEAEDHKHYPSTPESLLESLCNLGSPILHHAL